MHLSLNLALKARLLAFGLLDRFTGAEAAYSLRKLSSSTSNVVRVRRSSDDTEQDFTAAQVSDGTLESFCGVGDGFVAKWYDQSGNGRDLSQPIAENQPRIVNAGSLEVDGTGYPVINADGVNDFMDYVENLGTYGLSDLNASVFSVTTRSTNAGNPALIGNGATTFMSYGRYGGSGDVGFFVIDQTASAAGSLTNLSQISMFALSNGDTDAYLNGTQELNSNTSTTYTLNNFTILRRGSSYANSLISELIFYNTDQTANREAIEANQAAAYGIA